MLQKYMFIKEKASKNRLWVESRHHLIYIWHFFGYSILPEEYPSYDSTGMNDFHPTTRWIFNIMSLDDFFNKYQHLYLTNQQNNDDHYLFYKRHLHTIKIGSGKQILPISKQKQNSTMASGPLIYLNYFPLQKLNNKKREILQN